MQHSCVRCRKILRYAIRDALCLGCVAATHPDEFADEPKTMPNIVPSKLQNLTFTA